MTLVDPLDDAWALYDLAAEKWPAWALCDERPRDHETTTTQDAARFERDRSPDRETRVGGRRISVDDVPSPAEL